MTTLRIAIESGDAVRGASAARDALRDLGAQAIRTEREVEISAEEINAALGGFPVPTVDFSQLIEDARRARAELDFDRALEAPTVAHFGGNLAQTGLFSQAELGGTVEQIRLARAEAERADAEFSRLATDLAHIGTIAPAAFGPSALGARDLALQTVGAAEAARQLFSLPIDSASIREAEEEATRLGSSLETIGTIAPRSFGAAVQGADALAEASRRAVIAQEELFGSQLGPRIAAPVDLATSLGGGGTVIDSRGLELISAQERAYGSARTAAQAYGTGAATAVGGATSALDLNLRSLARVGGALLGIRGIASGIDSLVTYERGLVGVSQATGAVGDELEDLSQRILRVSTSGLPVLTTDLVSFTEAAGRLQIRSPEGIEQFVRGMAPLRTVAPDLGGGPEQAGEAVGRFLKLAGESPQSVEPLADSIARLDDEFGASASSIFDTGEQIAQASQGMIRGSADALGLGAAFASLGVEGSAAGGAIAQVMGVVRDAVQRGGQELRTLSEITGLVPGQIKEAFRTDSASLFVTVLEGLSRQGDNTTQAMDDLGLASARQSRVLGPLIANTGDLRRALQLSREAQLQGGDAARDAAQAQDTLGARLVATKNLFTAAVGANEGLVSSFSSLLDVGNRVAANLLGVSTESEKVGEASQLAADGLTAAAVAGAGALVVSRLAAGYRLLTAEVVGTTVATDLYTGAVVTSTTATTGLAAAAARTGAALAAFAASPLGIATAAGLAVAGLIAIDRALDEIDGTAAAEELDKVLQRMAGLDRAAEGLRDARNIIFKADLTGDAEEKVQGLQSRLRELQGAATVIAGEVRLNVEDVEPEFRQAFQSLSDSGSIAVGSDLEKRLNAALAASAAAVQIPALPPESLRGLQESIKEAFDGVSDGSADRFRAVLSEAFTGATPERAKELQVAVDELLESLDPSRALAFSGALDDALGGVSVERLATIKQSLAEAFAGVPPETAARLRASVAEAVSAAQIPAGKLEALKVEELFPDVQGAGLNFSAALEDALIGARQTVESERAALQAELAETLRVNPGQFAGSSLQVRIANLSTTTAFAERLAPEIQEQVSQLFGPALGERARTALEQSLAGAIKGVDPEALKIDLGTLATGDIDDEGIARLAATLEQAGASGISAVDALRAVDTAIQQTREQINATKFDPNQRPSDFYVDEANRIRAAIQDAELSIGRLSPRETVRQVGGDTVVSAPREDLTGLDAKREALIREREEYEETLRVRVRTLDQGQRISEGEARALGVQADRLLEARDAALLFGESQRRLGVEQGLLTTKSNLLGQQLQLLGLQAQGDTRHAFELLREQIELTRAEAEKEIEIRIAAGDTPDDEIELLRRKADAQKRYALATLEAQQYLAENRREIDLLAQASDSFANNAFDALIGLQDPIEALKSLLLDLGRSIVVPQLKAGFIDLLSGDNDKLKGAAAQQAGVRDLLPDGPPPEALPDLSLDKATEVAPINELAAASLAAAKPIEQLGVQALPAAGGLEALGTASQSAAVGAERMGAGGHAGATGAEHLARAAELAALALERLASQKAVSAPVEAAAGGLNLDLPERTVNPSQRLAAQAGPAGAAAGARAIGVAAGDAIGDALGDPESVLGAIGGPLPARAAQDASGAGLDLPDRRAAEASLQALGAARIPPAGPGAAPPGADLDQTLTGLDALDSGAEDAARAIAASTPSVRGLAAAAAPASRALGALPPQARDAAQALEEVVPTVEQTALPRRLLGHRDLEEIATARSELGLQGISLGADAAAGAAGGAFRDDQIGIALEPLRRAGEETAVSMGATAAASELAAGGLTATGFSADVTSLGLTQAQVAALGTVAAFNLATQAAASYAARLGAKAVLASIPGAGGAAEALADGGVPGVADLEGRIIGSPTYALIGEGADREAVMPLDAAGGVRGIGARGEPVSLHLQRDGSGKLGVRIPEQRVRTGDIDGLHLDRVERFALGGIPGGGPIDARSIVQIEASSSRGGARTSIDNSRQTTFNYRGGDIVIQGARSPLETGMRYSQRQIQESFRLAAQGQA